MKDLYLINVNNNILVHLKKKIFEMNFYCVLVHLKESEFGL